MEMLFSLQVPCKIFNTFLKPSSLVLFLCPKPRNFLPCFSSHKTITTRQDSSSQTTHEMGLVFFLSKEEKSKQLLWRAVKTLFFLITMFISFLLFSLPVLLAIADSLLPSALLSLSHSLSLETNFTNYDFRSSLIDIPLLSIIRSAVIICVYSFCDGPRLSRGPYLGVTTVCSVLSLMFVSLKASFVFSKGGEFSGTEVALFVCSLVLAIGHVVVAYRTSCRERRKLLVYKLDKIDIEAVSDGKNVFPRYHKLVQY